MVTEATKVLQDSPIQIGSISLQGFEIPASIRFGGRQKLVIHSLSGGRRIIEQLGPDDGEIAFQGTFSGPNAETRVRDFDEMRLLGAVVWLRWESFRRLVVVKSFVAEYQSPWWIPYRVDCVVAHQAGVTPPQVSQIADISADLTSAVSAVVGSAISLAGLQSAISGTNVLAVGTADRAQAIVAVGGALDNINDQISDQSAALVAPAGPPTEGGSIGSTFSAQVGSAGLLAAAVNARSYVGRIGANLTGSWS